MSGLTAKQPLPTGAQRWTVIVTLLVGAFVFSLNARGTILESDVIIQAFGLDHYKIQWILGAESVAVRPRESVPTTVEPLMYWPVVAERVAW